MPLAPGDRLGPYEVVRLIGAGGMGEVYRALDTRLDRTVAIKVLSTQFAGDPDRRARFEREARAVAALNHAHICAIHDVGEVSTPTSSGTDVVRFLVMEHLEGRTLAERLMRGALSPGEMLQYAIELADALDHAHRRGLVHRDLKPSNVMLIKSGAKLLDFGLSKLQAGSDLLALSTMSPGDAALTAAGSLLGTYPYMAPEQLAGKDADTRSDLFAFGAILYEMATGRRAFEGTSAATVIGAVLHTTPPAISTMQSLTPPVLDRIVARCLAKDPDDRWQAARDVLLELKWVGESEEAGSASGSTRLALRWGTRAVWMIAGAALLLLAASALGISYLRRMPARESVQRLSVESPPGVKFARPDVGGGAVISPDGERVVFVGIGADGKKLLWVRSLNDLEALPLTS